MSRGRGFVQRDPTLEASLPGGRRPSRVLHAGDGVEAVVHMTAVAVMDAQGRQAR